MQQEQAPTIRELHAAVETFSRMLVIGVKDRASRLIFRQLQVRQLVQLT